MIKKLCLLIVLLSLVAPVFGTSLPTQSKEESSLDSSPPLQDLAAEHSRITAHIDEATNRLVDARHALESMDTMGKDKDERSLQDRISLLQARIQLGRRHLKAINDAQIIRDEKRQLQEDFNNWTGFPDPPPYSFDLVEEIARQLKSQQATIKTDEMRLTSFTHVSGLAIEAMETARKAFRKDLEALEAAITDEVKQIARERYTLSQLTLQVSEESVAFVRASNQMLQEKQGYNKFREELLQKKLMVALQNVQLAKEAFQVKNVGLQKELTTVEKELETIIVSQTAASQQLEKVQQRIQEKQKQGEKADSILILEMKLRQKQLEVLLATVEDANLRIAYIQMMQEYWRKYFALQNNWELSAAKPLLSEFQSVLPIAKEAISAMVLARGEIDDFAVEGQFNLPELFELRGNLAAFVDIRSEQLNAARRSAEQMIDSIKLWEKIVNIRIGTMDLAEHAKGWEDILSEYFQRIWSFEILSIEDTMLVDGQRIVEHRPVTMGKVIQALLILIIGLVFASWLAGIVSRIVFPFSGVQGQRRLLIQKILRVCMIAGVVVLSLATVKIPLTVFAFLGGAIAIGIGFGAQNLLNNFISGFILLGESPIRVGDLIEVEGNEGIVKLIGDRCTHVRRLDGVEMLIPNSQLLERSVTNMTLSDRYLRKVIKVGVAYGVPTRQVHQLLLEIVKAHELVVIDPEPVVIFEDFGDNALIFSAYLWLDLASQKDFREVISDLRHTISERFAENGYQIAFPQRDVHLDVKDPIAVQVQTLSTAR